MTLLVDHSTLADCSRANSAAEVSSRCRTTCSPTWARSDSFGSRINCTSSVCHLFAAQAPTDAQSCAALLTRRTSRLSGPREAREPCLTADDRALEYPGHGFPHVRLEQLVLSAVRQRCVFFLRTTPTCSRWTRLTVSSLIMHPRSAHTCLRNGWMNRR